MNLEEALKVADDAVFNKTGEYLSDLQKLIFQESWDNKAYDEIADKHYKSRQHVKNEGNKLWKLLTNALGEKVSKSNFRAALERYQRSLHKSEENPVPPTLPVSPASNSEIEINALVQEVRKKVKPYYEKRHGTLKVLGMREPVKLESVYTAVQFLDNEVIRSFESIENLEQFYRQSSNRRFQPQNQCKQEGIEVADDKQYLMVLGGPGAGKSTFLRKMGLEALKGKRGKFKHICIPVFIELKTFTSTNIDIKKIIVEEFRISGFPSADEFTEKALEEGKLLILLDGLDEVPTQNLNETISRIQKFVDTYDKNRFIASCRTAAYRSRFRRFSDVAMADFDDTQIQQFIYNWFHSEADKQAQTGEKCWELLQKPENAAAKELAHTPLLLTFLCLVYDRSQNFPDNRSVLYKKALRILLEEWASEKRILRDEIYQGLHTELEEILLSEIAYTNFESDRLFFSQPDVVQQIKTFLASNLNAPQHLDGEAVLNAIVVQQGILVERAEDVFSFSHLTLQEYLTARYIHEHRQVEELVTEHLTDKRWQEVFLLVAGLMWAGADNLLLWMEKEAQKYMNTPQLQALLNWAERSTTGSAGELKPVGKRAVAISIAKANANAEVIANSITKAYANAIANTYAEAIANSITKAYAEAEAIVNAEAEFITKAIAIANSEAEAEAIANTYAEAIAIANYKAIADAFDEGFCEAIADAFADANVNVNAITKANAEAIAIANAIANSDANANAYSITYAIAYVNTIANSDAIANAIAKAKAKAIANSDAIANANGITNTIANGITNSIANGIANDITNSIANGIANGIANAINYSRQLEELKIFNNVNFTMLIDELNELKTKIPDNKQPLEVHRTFLKHVQQTLLNAFHLSPDMINLSQEEAKALENYLYANNLIIQCKQASVRVSPITWEGIEARLLLVPSN